ncbi:MAG: hypothetical protein OHK0013_03060 [Sandaracinaceae bacterium]
MIPVPVALSVWGGGAGVLALALVLSGLSAREPEPSVDVVSRQATASAPSGAGRRLPDGRDEAGSLTSARGHLRASLPWANDAAVYGWGTVRLDAEPEENELTVRTIVDVPTRARRWSAACELRVDVDGTEVRVAAQPVGTRLKGGDFYDALRLEVGIDVLRRMARAHTVRGEICGDPFELPEVQRATLRAFVERFDALALPVAVPREERVPLAPADPEEIVEDPDALLEPA